MSKLVEVARFSNSLDAGVAQSRLEADGLHCVLFDSGFSAVEAVGLFIPRAADGARRGSGGSAGDPG